MVKATFVSKANTCVQSRRTNIFYRPYAQSAIATAKYPMASPHDFVRRDLNPVVPVRDQIIGLSRTMVVSILMAVIEYVCHSDQI